MCRWMVSGQSGQAAGVRGLSLLRLCPRLCGTQLTWGSSVTPEASCRQHLMLPESGQAWFRASKDQVPELLDISEHSQCRAKTAPPEADWGLPSDHGSCVWAKLLSNYIELQTRQNCVSWKACTWNQGKSRGGQAWWKSGARHHVAEFIAILGRKSGERWPREAACDTVEHESNAFTWSRWFWKEMCHFATNISSFPLELNITPSWKNHIKIVFLPVSYSKHSPCCSACWDNLVEKEAP